MSSAKTSKVLSSTVRKTVLSPTRTRPAEAILAECEPEAVAAGLPETSDRRGGTPDLGVEVEAAELSLARSARGGVT